MTGTYTIDEIDEALYLRGIPSVTNVYVSAMNGDAIEIQYVCFPPGKLFTDDGNFMVFSAFWVWRNLDEIHYKIIMDGRQRLLSGVLHEYEMRVKRLLEGR